MTEIIDEAGFDALEGEWERLVDRCAMPSPFLSWDWNRTWWKILGQGNQLRILAFWAGDRLMGLAQLHERRSRIGPMRISTLYPIGWECGGNQPLTEHLEFLFPEPCRRPLMEALLSWFACTRHTTIWLPSVLDGTALPAWAARRVAERLYPVEFHGRALPDAWEEFVAGLNKSMRDNVKYYPRLMVRHGHEFSLDVGRSPQEVARFLPVLLRLHALRARADFRVRHHDHFLDQRHQEFMTELAPRLAAKGELGIALLQVRGETVAAQMWLERGSTMFSYYSGYRPEWAKYSVALVTKIEVFKDAIRRGIGRVEFLRGGGQLKERWDTRREVRRHVQVERRRGFVRTLKSLRRLGVRK